MNQRVFRVALWVGAVGWLAAGVLAQSSRPRTAWEEWVARDPQVVDDAGVGWRDRLILHVLTPDQAESYFKKGADPQSLLLDSGRTLKEYLDAKLSPPAGVYVALAFPCVLFASDQIQAGENYHIQVRGTDLQSQGGSSTGCGIPDEATAVILQLKVVAAEGPTRVKLWAPNGPEPAEAALRVGDDAVPAGQGAVVVTLGEADGLQGDLTLRSTGSVAVGGEAVGYFRALRAGDVPFGGVAFYTEGLTNSFFGEGAGGSTSGTFNSFFGAAAGNANTAGNNNSFFGGWAGKLNTLGSFNTAVGTAALRDNSAGAGNTAVGFEALRENEVSDSVAVGYWALLSNTTGLYNTALGSFALRDNLTGQKNTAVGFAALRESEGSFNTAVGTDALLNNTANSNTALGNAALLSNTSGGANTAVGESALFSNLNGVGDTAIGREAGYKSTGSYNTFSGYQAGYGITAGTNNTGSYQSIYGFWSGRFNTTGYDNAFFGDYSGHHNTSGNNNTFLGSEAGSANTTGNYNAFFGAEAGRTNTVESNNSLIGANSRGAAGITNATALGFRAQVSQSNSLVLGSIAGLNGAAASVNVGIGTPAPERQLHLKGNNAVFRMDRTVDTASFMIVRTSAAGAPLKTFLVGTNAAGVNNGEFIINDLGAAVGGGGARRMTIQNTGAVDFPGDVTGRSFFATSTLRRKDQVVTLQDALETVGRLRGVHFVWKDTGKPSVGLIAEEVVEVLPEVVERDSDSGEVSGVNYAALVAVLVEAVKTQQAELTSIRAELAAMKSLEIRLAALEQLSKSLQARRALVLRPHPSVAGDPTD